MTTRLIRWRPYDRLHADKALATGDTGIDGLDGLVVIEKRGNLRDGTGGWSVVIRQARQEGASDGWLWMPPSTGEPFDECMQNLPSEREARIVVAEHWEAIERQAREALAAAEPVPVAAQDAVEEQAARLATEETLGFHQSDMLSTVAAVTPPVTEARDARVSEDFQNALIALYVDEVQGVVERLRHAADLIAHRPVRQNLRDQRLDHSQHAGEVLDEVRAMVGNLRLGALSRAARDADLAVRGRML